MLKPVLRRGRVLFCGSCMDARGLAADEVVEGAARSSLEELTHLSLAADKVIVFETGDAKAGFGAGDFYAEPRPAVTVRRPGRTWHAGKVLLEKQILWSWL